MAKSSRASRIKKNNQALKRKVFGPVEQARNERLNAKLLELAQKPKEKEQEMDVEPEGESDVDHTGPQHHPDMQEVSATKDDKEETAQQDLDMTEDAKPRRSKREVKRLQEARAQRREQSSRKKPRNQVRFPTPARKKKVGKR